MYSTDTPLKKIVSHDYNSETGEIANKRVFVDLEVGREGGREGYLSVGQVRFFFSLPGDRSVGCLASE